MCTGHIPVLFDEALELLNLKSGNTVVDGTLGGAGHARAILENIVPNGLLIGIDKDEAAIQRGELYLAQYSHNIELVHSDFKNIAKILQELGVKQIDAAILDLGVSSYQLDDAKRGFSYKYNSRLDMRMNQDNDVTAEYIVNRYSQEELERLIKEYGEEKWAARIAEFIVTERKCKQIETTEDLVEVIKKAIPKAARRNGRHPAKRTFQALRIEVNKELESLDTALSKYIEYLSPNGRLAVITFHSLEDRIVKSTFKKLQGACECPKDLPVCICGSKKIGRVITKKPIIPDESEIDNNPRARSAKLRVFEKGS